MSNIPEGRPAVLITGASGRVGRRVVEALSPSYRIIALDVAEPDAELDVAEFVECDLTDDDAVRTALGRVRESTRSLASVIHLAAYYDFSGEPSPLYDELTVRGTRRVLDGLATFDEVGQIVFSSSMLVMKESAEGEPITEDGELEALWPYPQSKIEAEKVIAEHRGDVPAVVLRIAGAYDEQGHSIPLVQQARRIYEKQLESYLFPGNPHHGQSFVHFEDVADCVRRVVDARDRLEPWEVFLVGEPENPSYAELQDRMGEILHGKEWTTIRIPAPVAKAGAWLLSKLPSGGEEFIKPWMIDLADANYPLSIERARVRLGWEPRHRLADALAPMLRSLKDDPVAWYGANGLEPPSELEEAEASAGRSRRPDR